MCGIVGYKGLSLEEGERLPLLRRMCDAVIHRGPDDSGYYADDEVGIGMRRLSIIDLVAGRQPISSDDGTYRLVFNGEIYNYRAIRSKLIEKGYRFKTESDTEVLLKQLEDSGLEGLHQLNGMFAFALWHKPQRRLFLARDRLGVKPLYYHWDGTRFLFASEIKAILQSGQVDRKLNRRGVWDYLTLRYVPAPHTVWENIFKLPPAHTLVLNDDGCGPVVRRYWDIPYGPAPIERSDPEYDREFAELFSDAVLLRMVAADVPVGITLSGGIDSSSVAAVAAANLGPKLKTFSVSFADSPETNELPYARIVADHIQSDHHEIVIGQREFCDFLPEFVRLTDEPLADLASIPLYYVSRLASKSVKVVLSGEGSDEVLGGYDFNLLVQVWDRHRRLARIPHFLRSGAALRLVESISPRLAQDLRNADVPMDYRTVQPPPNMTNYMSSQDKITLMGNGTGFADTMLPLKDDLDRLGQCDPLHQLLYAFCQSWLVEDLLMKADKMAMANSLELRTPFLDYRLVEWAARSPAWVKVGRDNGGYATKRILRRFARNILPEKIITRPKQGFPVPVYDWLTSRLKSWAIELLTSSDSRLRHHFVPREVDRLMMLGIDETGTLLDKHRLWNILILELWMREWIPV